MDKKRREHISRVAEGLKRDGMKHYRIPFDELRALLDLADERDAKDEEIASLIDAQADKREALEQAERERDRYRALLESLVDVVRNHQGASAADRLKAALEGK